MHIRNLSRASLILLLVFFGVSVSTVFALEHVADVPAFRNNVQFETEEQATEEPDTQTEATAEAATETEEEPETVQDAPVVEEENEEALGTGLLILLMGIGGVVAVGSLVIMRDRFNRSA